ncbi:MAG: hypothetical protein IJR82_04060 [Bacilli bacterium]|nr:hypothetical protein [Bacilli bacterium]
MIPKFKLQKKLMMGIFNNKIYANYVKVMKKVGTGIIALSTVFSIQSFFQNDVDESEYSNSLNDYKSSSDSDNSELCDNIETSLNSDNLDTSDYIKVYPGSDNLESYLSVGNDLAIQEVRDFLEDSESGNLIKKYSQMYGIDPNIIASICKIESLTLNHEDCVPGGFLYNGYGVGLLQLDFDQEYNEEHKVYVYAKNYLTGENDQVQLNMENAVNEETNIQIGCMLFQNNLEASKGNPLLAIYMHNFGYPMTNLVLEVNNLGETITNFKDHRWIAAMQDAHKNPHKYLSDWPENSYGGNNYLKRVLSFCPSQDAVFCYGGKVWKFNLCTSNVENIDTINNYYTNLRNSAKVK